VFNSTGFNAEIASGTVEGAPNPVGDQEVWAVADGEVSVVLGDELPDARDAGGSPSSLHLLRVIAGLLLLLLPGLLIYRVVLRDGGLPEALGLLPALSFLTLSLVGTLLVAVIRGPFDEVMGWATLALTVALCGGWTLMTRMRPRTG
jgi:hypothetical protein